MPNRKELVRKGRSVSCQQLCRRAALFKTLNKQPLKRGKTGEHQWPSQLEILPRNLM